ncbi:tripartite tricarboxylate transporter substrate binding protein [Lampropedia puyangensis]|uniref:Tripartite tricarboxylate transporter substrate binding protein n=2 Tax=Lampropedia puyangensis TaxID=1330072 RepID=A0A4S8F894_9BURK|nr:tripartite tricarboxylate transporter substrate binding protein [Lampropedia puyangensis]
MTLMVNGGPGSLPDIFARPLADKLRKSLGQAVVVDNRPGAGGMVAMQHLKEAGPSGHTLAIITNAHAVWNPYVFPSLTYNPTTDLQPVSPIAILPMAMAVNPKLGVSSVQELVAKAKAEPGVINYASSGNGSPPHVLFEVWRSQAGLDIVHIPFKTGTDALTSTVAGDTQVYFAGTALVEAMAKDKKLQVLAVSPHVESPTFAHAPTMEQAGFPGYESAVWLGVVAPAGTPDAVVNKLNTAISEALRDPAFATIMKANGSIPLHESAQDFAQRIAKERAEWGPQIEKIGIRPN